MESHVELEGGLSADTSIDPVVTRHLPIGWTSVDIPRHSRRLPHLAAQDVIDGVNSGFARGWTAFTMHQSPCHSFNNNRLY